MPDLLEIFRLGARKPKFGLVLQSDISKYSDADFRALFPHLKRGEKPANWLLPQDADEELRRLFERSLVSINMPHLQPLRKAAQMFYVDTLWSVEQHDSARAVANIETMFGLARQSTDCGFVVSSLAGLAISSMTFNLIEEIVVENPDFLDQQQLAKLQSALESIRIPDWFDFEWERASMHDVIQRVYSNDGNDSGRMTPFGVQAMTMISGWNYDPNYQPKLDFKRVLEIAHPVVAPASLFLLASRKETTDKCNELIDKIQLDFNKPFWDAQHPDIDGFLEQHSTRYQLLTSMFPPVSPMRNVMDRTIGRQEGVIAALAIHRYQLRYGKWPKSFDDFAPEFVTEFPVDVINGEFLKFKSDDNGILIYSVGNDRQDDGGIPPVTIYRNGGKVIRYPVDHFMLNSGPNNDSYDGDWILWPQQNPQKTANNDL